MRGAGQMTPVDRTRGSHAPNDRCGLRCRSETELQVEGEVPFGLVWRDREGKRLDEGIPAVGKSMRYTVDHGGKVPREPREAPSEEDTTIYSLDEVPDQVDSAWWRKYGHNFEFKGTRLVLNNAMG